MRAGMDDGYDYERGEKAAIGLGVFVFSCIFMGVFGMCIGDTSGYNRGRREGYTAAYKEVIKIILNGRDSKKKLLQKYIDTLSDD